MQSIDFFILGIIFGALIFYRLTGWVKKKNLQARLVNARKAEIQAVKLLQKAGYDIIDTQKRVQVKTKIDGVNYTNTIIADLIVKKNGKTYLVEVKTGKQTERLTASNIRRQLLEYFLVFKPHGLILFNMSEKKMHQVEFELEGLRPQRTLALYGGAMFFLGAILTYGFIFLIGR